MKKIIGVFKINQHIYTHEIKKKSEDDDQHGDVCLTLDDEDEQMSDKPEGAPDVEIEKELLGGIQVKKDVQILVESIVIIYLN